MNTHNENEATCLEFKWGRAVAFTKVFSILLTIFCQLSYASDADNNYVWESQELSITTITRRDTGVYCNGEAARIIDIHKMEKANLEPGELVTPTVSSKALLGLVVQVRGENYARKDLDFELDLRFRDREKIYRGTWEYRKINPEDSTARTHARTTDWWINLERLFSENEIKDICRNRTKLSVQYRSHKFPIK